VWHIARNKTKESRVANPNTSIAGPRALLPNIGNEKSGRAKDCGGMNEPSQPTSKIDMIGSEQALLETKNAKPNLATARANSDSSMSTKSKANISGPKQNLP